MALVRIAARRETQVPKTIKWSFTRRTSQSPVKCWFSSAASVIGINPVSSRAVTIMRTGAMQKGFCP